MNQLSNFEKRSRAKWSQSYLIEALINLNSPLKKKYEQTKNCASMLFKNGDKITSRYCGRRWCKICCKIRTGTLLNHYSPILEKLPELQLLTLTVPNVSEIDLKGKIKEMIAACRDIQEGRRKKKLPKITGIRKLECTYNAKENTYHPHFHFIISGETRAQEFLQAWLNIFPEASILGQDLRPCTTYKELFKYFTKFTSKVGKDKTGKNLEIHFPQALDNIFAAIEGVRIIQPFGIKIISEEVEPEIAIQDPAFLQLTEGTYYWNKNYWINLTTAEFIGYFEPEPAKVQFYRKIAYFCT
jgi:hypothetical protein